MLTLRATLQNDIDLAEQGLINHQHIGDLLQRKDEQYYVASNAERTILLFQEPGRWSDALANQLTASQALLPTLQQVLKNIDNSLWIFYVSAEGFSFLTPEIPQIPSKERTYNSIFWQQTIPEHNPDLKMIVTDAYEDYFSKTLVITITLPVSLHGEFIGVIGFDLGISALTNLSQQYESVGKTYIIDNHNSVINPAGEILARINLDADKSGNRANADSRLRSNFSYTNSTYWSKNPIFDDELYALHVLDLPTLLLEAIYQSIAEYIAITLTAILLVFFILRLRIYSNAITELSNSDPLTGLLNRRAMKEIAEYQISMCQRNGRPFSIAMLDIDHFKRFNDTHGHDTGDSILKSFAEIMRVKTRANDVICRYGGEEFVVCLPELNKQEASGIVQRFKSLDIGAGDYPQLRVSFSAGIAEIGDNETLEDAIIRADQALLRAKALGRNRIEISELESVLLNEHLSLNQN